MAKYEFRKVLNLLGFVATLLIALAILIASIINWVQSGTFSAGLAGLQISNFQTGLVFVANIFAYFLACVGGFAYARSKRSVWYVIIQVIAVAIILFVVITNLFF